MARDWVATTYARVILDVSFRVFYLPVWVLAKFASCVRSLVRIWSLNNLPDKYSHTMHLCSYVFGHLSADHTYMVMRHKYLRTCMVTLQQTRRVWLHDVSVLVCVCFFFQLTRYVWSRDTTVPVRVWSYYKWESRLIVSTYPRFAHDWIDLRTRKKGPCSIHV